MILCVRAYVFTSELTQVNLLSLPPSQRNPISGGVFFIQSRITNWCSGSLHKGRHPQCWRCSHSIWKLSSPVFSHTSLSPENHSNLHTLTWAGVCLHHHLIPHSMPVLDSLILRIAQTLIHSFAIFGKYQVGPLKEKSKCYVLSILLWEYLPADSMDENVPDWLSCALQRPPATPYSLCKLRNSRLVMSYIQDQNVESQLHSMSTPSIRTAAQLRIWTEKRLQMTAMS